MKSKPDIRSFSGSDARKDPSDFIDGGVADRAENKKSNEQMPASALVKPEPTIQKLFRLRWDTANALKLGAAQMSASKGRRVTETEIIEELLRVHFKLDI